MRFVRILACLTMLTSLFGCGGKESPVILDGPGMVYVDAEYRTDYANCLPFEDMRGAPYLAIAYLGSGADGEAQLAVYAEKIFSSLGEEKIRGLQTYTYAGEAWFLVIPRYGGEVELKKDGETLCVASYTGEAFAVRCNQDLEVCTFDAQAVCYALRADADGALLQADENVWDITNIDAILKQ